MHRPWYESHALLAAVRRTDLRSCQALCMLPRVHPQRAWACARQARTRTGNGAPVAPCGWIRLRAVAVPCGSTTASEPHSLPRAAGTEWNGTAVWSHAVDTAAHTHWFSAAVLHGQCSAVQCRMDSSCPTGKCTGTKPHRCAPLRCHENITLFRSNGLSFNILSFNIRSVS